MQGLIGYFDILGYQNFLENNSADKSINRVFEIITKIPTEIKNLSNDIAGKSNNTVENSYHHALKHYVFSDTIVFTLEYPENPDEEWLNGALIHMTGCCARLFGEMHLNGLPVQGIIHEGKFFAINGDHVMSLAGEAIVEAYQLAKKINLSSLVYSESLSKKVMLKKSSINNDTVPQFTYRTPRKDETDTKMANINWIYFLNNAEISECRKDIENFVLKSFWAHQKDCPSSVDIKTQNTIKVIRKMILNIDDKNKPL